MAQLSTISESGLERLYYSLFQVPIGAEKDLGFHINTLRWNRRAMSAIGALGITGSALYLLTQLIFTGKEMTWGYGDLTADVLVVTDKLLVLLLGVACLALSKTRSGPLWGRLCVAVLLVIASLVMVFDDIARADISFSPAYLVLLMFLSLGAPFRALQTLALSATMIGLFTISAVHLPGLVGWLPVSLELDRMIFLVLAALICTGLSALLYRGRYRQQEARNQLAAVNRKLRTTQLQLIQSGKMAALGNLVAGIAHEINTPLGVIQSNANVAAHALNAMRPLVEDGDSLSDEESRSKLKRAVKALSDVTLLTLSSTGRIDKIVKALRNFVGLDEAERKQYLLHDGIESTLTILPLNPNKKIQIVKGYGDLPEINCRPGQINQVFMNILMNAVEAIEQEGTITITTRMDTDWAVVRIEDNGRGIPQEKQSQVFDPGFTTKGVGVGTGLGLAICYRIMEYHRGEIELSSEPGKGTAVTVRLPAS